MAWFEIIGHEIWSDDHIPCGFGGEHYLYGMKLGGRWCLDYTFKLMFDISDKDWKDKCCNLRTDKDFYNLCEWLGIYYMKDNIIYRQGKKYDKYGNKL